MNVFKFYRASRESSGDTFSHLSLNPLAYETTDPNKHSLQQYKCIQTRPTHLISEHFQAYIPTIIIHSTWTLETSYVTILYQHSCCMTYVTTTKSSQSMVLIRDKRLGQVRKSLLLMLIMFTGMYVHTLIALLKIIVAFHSTSGGNDWKKLKPVRYFVLTNEYCWCCIAELCHALSTPSSVDVRSSHLNARNCSAQKLKKIQCKVWEK